MSEKISYTGQEEADFIEEDERSEVIKNLTDPDEVKAAQELIEEKYDEPDIPDTSSGSVEPKTEEKPVEDTSKSELEDKTKSDENGIKTDEESEKPKEVDQPADDKFKLTDELIEKQPEADREILNKYAGKTKEELAKAAANAIALKNDYLKGNKKAIEAVAEKILEKSEEEILTELVNSQRETGKVGTAPEGIQELDEPEIVLPTLAKEDEKIQEILSSEVTKRMKKLYPDMPTDPNSAEYMEWERELQDEKGIRGAEKLLTDFRNVEREVGTELQTVVYAQESLENLWIDSADEIMPYLTEENLPKLKHINDNFLAINNNTIQREVELIKSELQKFNVTAEDLGIDLTLAKDENGSLYSDDLNNYFYNGDEVDPEVIGRLGKVNILKAGTLARKFIQENNSDILTKMVAQKAVKDKTEREKLKDETLSSISSVSPGNKATPDVDVTKVTDPDAIKKVMDNLESKYS